MPQISAVDAGRSDGAGSEKIIVALIEIAVGSES
jgi:hypothetical protein